MDDMKVKFNRSGGKTCGNNIDIVDVVYRAILEKDKFESKFMNITDEPAVDLIYAGIVATYNPTVNEYLEDFNYKTTKELLNVIRSFIHGKTIDIKAGTNINLVAAANTLTINGIPYLNLVAIRLSNSQLIEV
jgi:hypothetical protein